MMKLNNDELKVLTFCSKEVMYEQNPPVKELGMQEKSLIKVLEKLKKLKLVYKDNINDKLTAYSSTLEGDKVLKKLVRR